jgi:UDPglucose--hexose-1-phosphate uridylyltransferase
LRKIKGIKYVIVFKNEGGKAGASIAHSHSQVIALPLIPPEIKKEYEDYGDYRVEHGSCPFCDAIKTEEGKSRVIWEDKNLFVLSPFASQFPYGAWFLPKRHFKSMDEITESEKASFAKALKIMLAKLDQIDVAYNYFFHNSVNGEDFHMHLKLEPRPNVWAGLELGTGVIINAVPPEDAAKFYQK